MHDNRQAIRLYERLGFERIPAFAVKNKNAYNEPLFMGPTPEANLNPYAAIIVNEARRRGIGIEVLDAEAGYFALVLGGRRIVCRESSQRAHHGDRHEPLRRQGGHPPGAAPGRTAGPRADPGRVAGPGGGLSVHARAGWWSSRPGASRGPGSAWTCATPRPWSSAIEGAQAGLRRGDPGGDSIEGEDLRIVVIDYQVVAAAIRRPAQVVGNGRQTIRELIQAQSRGAGAPPPAARAPSPWTAETERCIAQAGYGWDDVLPDGQVLQVRKTANLHTGGTIHDVTAELHPKLAADAVAAARALDIPVTGLDFLVPSVEQPEYVIIEANERPGLANHEPQPTAKRFVDLLFPHDRRPGGHPLKLPAIDSEYLVDILLRLLFTPSPSGYTDRVVHLVCEELERLDVPFELTRRGAIRATLSGKVSSRTGRSWPTSTPWAPWSRRSRTTGGCIWSRSATGTPASPRARGSPCSWTPVSRAAPSCR